MLVPIRRSGGLMYWSRATVVSVEKYVTAKIDDNQYRFDRSTGEQIDGPHRPRGPRRIDTWTTAMEARVAEDAVKVSEYNRREKSLAYLRTINYYAWSAASVEKLAALAAELDPVGDSDLVERVEHES
jgi:hypothetical protein